MFLIFSVGILFVFWMPRPFTVNVFDTENDLLHDLAANDVLLLVLCLLTSSATRV